MNKQYIDTDIMRIVASFCVVMIHVVTCTESDLILDKNLSVFINTICRFSVPVFVMISGRYMLENKHNTPHLIKKSLKLIIAMIFCAAVYTAHDMIVGGIAYNAQAFIVKILTSPIHLWYIYDMLFVFVHTAVQRFCSERCKETAGLYYLFMLLFWVNIIHTITYGRIL